MIKGLTHVAIRVTDIDRSVRFYTEGLGLEEQFRLTDEQGRPHLVYIRVAPGQFVELFPGAEGPRQEMKSSGSVHICLEVDDIQSSREELVQRGVENVSEPKLGGDNSWQFWTSDPDGNPIEFHQFTPDSMQMGGK